MGWLFLFAILFLMVFLVLDSNRTRMVALGVLAFVVAVVVFYFTYIDDAEQQAVPPAAEEKLQDTRALAKKAELVRRAIKPQEVVVLDQRFGPGVEQYYGSDGQLKEREDLYSWSFAGNLKNANAEYVVRDAVFRVRLFSCPDFVKGDIEPSKMEVRCNKIGDRRVVLYDLNIAPGSSQAFKEVVTFDNQPAPGNWRHQIEPLSVTARIE